MFTILLHSSKTMRAPAGNASPVQVPALQKHANELADYLKSLTQSELQTAMKLSAPMAAKTRALIAAWRDEPSEMLPAIDAFIGDIYSGLQVESFTQSDQTYANDHLFILSGLYGVLRALDTIQPYRLEMGYRLPDSPFQNLYAYWNDTIARQLPDDQTIINLSAVEYTKAVFPHLHTSHIITPKFLTVSQATGEPIFVTVHAKVARGAYTHWLIKNRIDDIDRLIDFDELGYHYDPSRSAPDEPVYVCQAFGGIGMSVRLK